MGKETVKLGLYGCGNRTRALLNSVYGEGLYEVAASFDINAQKVKEVTERYGGKGCLSAEELINAKGVDAFIISLDPFAHPDAFDKTIEAGKPIYIEKPIAMSAERAYRMLEKTREKNVPVHVGLMRRYEPQHIAARRYIADNPPGRLFGISCNWFHPGETEMINCLYNQPDNFRLKVSQIPFHCCHALDVMRTYAGEVHRVEAMGIKWVERQYPSPDNVIAALEFENGSIGSFHYTSMSYKGELSYIVHFENYTLDFRNGLEIWSRPVTRYQREGEMLWNKKTEGSRWIDCRDTYHKNIGPEKHNFAVGGLPDHLAMKDFLSSVRNGTPMKITMEDGYRVAEMAEAIETSYVQKKPVTLPMTF
jgi:1,5-anhydro-D-fructose reductase (1,5-anhydro-D-mannitol-forming)